MNNITNYELRFKYGKLSIARVCLFEHNIGVSKLLHNTGNKTTETLINN